VAGGVLNLSTKSGTNTFHGEAYEYIRNKVFNANDWFSNNGGLKKAPWIQNQFGGNVGGRIWKDRTFFFTALRLPPALLGKFLDTVPTDAIQSAVASGGPVDLTNLAADPNVNIKAIVDPCGGNITNTPGVLGMPAAP